MHDFVLFMFVEKVMGMTSHFLLMLFTLTLAHICASAIFYIPDRFLVDESESAFS